MPNYRNRATGEVIQSTPEEMAYTQGWDKVQPPSEPLQRIAFKAATEKPAAKSRRSADSAKFGLGGPVSVMQLRLIFGLVAFMFFALATVMRSGDEWVALVPCVVCLALIPFAAKIIRAREERHD